jgi:hypothetical protein
VAPQFWGEGRSMLKMAAILPRELAPVAAEVGRFSFRGFAIGLLGWMGWGADRWSLQYDERVSPFSMMRAL